MLGHRQCMIIHIILVLLVLFGCDHDQATSPLAAEGQMTFASSCKTDDPSMSSYDPKRSEECIRFTYQNDHTLFLNHINAGFNCCPGTIAAEIGIDGDTITIKEYEIHDDYGPCNCLCLYDVDYKLQNLQRQSYFLRMDGPQIDPYEVRIDLDSTSTGLICIARNDYPWDD